MCLLLDFEASHVIFVIEKAKDTRLENVNNQCVLLLGESCLDLNVAIGEEPVKLPVRVCIFVPKVKPLGASIELSGQLTQILLHRWPHTRLQDFDLKLDTLDIIAHRSLEILLQIFAQLNVFHHFRHL